MFLVNLKKFIKYFANNKKKELFAYIIMSYFASILEVFGVAIVYPFILILLKPDFYYKLPIHISPIWLGIGIFLIFVFKNIYMVWCIKYQAKLVKEIETDIMKQFFNFFLFSSYQITYTIPRAYKERVLTVITLESVNNFFVRVLNLNINAAIVVSILLLLFVKFPIPAIVTSVFAAFIIVIQNQKNKKSLKLSSEKLWAEQKYYDELKAAIMPNLKLIKITGNETDIDNAINSTLDKLKIVQADFFAKNSYQPYVLEPLVILLLFIMLGVIYLTEPNDTNILIASFAIVASAIFRILPALARIQTSLNGILLGRKYVKELIEFYEKFNINNFSKYSFDKNIEFNQSIRLENVSFGYIANKKILKNISLEIEKKSFIGVIGESGAGKTTLIDIISGLLPITEGNILIDGKCTDNYEQIRNLIGYVPQEPVFFNSSFRENIAFGASKIDDDRVINVLQQASIYEYIEKNFSQGIYASPMVDTVGLSLGQKQRLSIARALYKNPQILILDEATSALDLKTEEDICNELNKLKSNITIIAVAHRLSTLKNCDKIIYLKDGKINAIGNFYELEKNNAEFQELIKIQKLNSN